MNKGKTYRDFPVISTGTGKCENAILTEAQIDGLEPSLCPKTGLQAFPTNIKCLGQATLWAVQEIVKIKHDLVKMGLKNEKI